MTTVVLSPTHIACDHTVVHQSFPHQTKTDVKHKKIFIAPHKKFLIGTSGEYDPQQIDCDKTWNVLGNILSWILASLAEFGLDNDGCLLADKSLSMDYYEKIFDPGGYTFIVTKKYRFVIKHSTVFKKWYAKQISDYAGIGTGGNFAAGLLIGGMNIHDIWETVHRFDHLSSQEHTVIPLSMLKNSKTLDAKLKLIREGVTDPSKESLA